MLLHDLQAFLDTMTASEIAFFNAEIKQAILAKQLENSDNEKGYYFDLFLIGAIFVYYIWLPNYLEYNAEFALITGHIITNYYNLPEENTYTLLTQLYAEFSEEEAFLITVNALAKILL